MKNIARYLTLKNVASGPVALIMSAWLVFANLVDSSTNGLGNIVERILIVMGTLSLFYLALWLCDVVIIRRIPQKNQWLALWIAIALLAMGRGWLFAVIWQQLGYTQELALWSRSIAGLINLAVLMVFITVAYGMLREAAQDRREVVASRARLIALRNDSVQNRAAQNEALLERVRSRLADALSLDLLDTPENTVNSLRSSIDEVIRPLTRTLAQRSESTASVITPGRPRIAVAKYIRRLMDVHELQILPGVVLFTLLMLTPMVNVFGTTIGPLADLLLVSVLLITTWVLKWLAVKCGDGVLSWSTPVVLLSSASLGVLVLISFIPTKLQSSFLVGTVGVYLFCVLVPVAVRIAIEDARNSAAELELENEELRWEIARSNEVSQQQNRVIATALHGRLQAALAAAAFRLQLAMNNGEDPALAQQAARNEAEKAIAFDVDVEEAPRPLVETTTEITELWQGVCDIELVSSYKEISRVDEDAVCSRLCAELVIELCTNAIKHGKATRIEMSIAQSEERLITIKISNNGQGLDAISAGYGTQLLNQSCFDWSQESKDDITTVRAKVPFAG